MSRLLSRRVLPVDSFSLLPSSRRSTYRSLASDPRGWDARPTVSKRGSVRWLSCMGRGAEETEPLLREPDVLKREDPLSMRTELMELVRLSAPAFCQGFLAFSLTSVVFLFIGRLGSLQLSVASLASSFFYLTGASIISGFSMGIETIGGQANGAGNEHLVHVVFLQGMLLGLTACLAISLLWSRAEWLFVKLGQDAGISRKAALYLQLLIPYLFLETGFSCRAKSLASRGIVRPTTVACCCAAILAPIVSWSLIFKTRLGLYGAPVTLFLIAAVSLAMLQLLAGSYGTTISQPISQWMRDVWSSLWTYLSVTLPALATICSEWWVYEIFTVVAGLLMHPELSLGIMGAANSIINILFVFALSLAAGVIVRVSNFLGAGQKRAALGSVRTAISLSLCVESISLCLMYLFAKPISKIWFTEAAAGSLFVSVLPLVGITEWGSGMSFVLGAILRACNRGNYGFLANFFCYWFIGIPLGCLLGFYYKMGVVGFWIGLASASQMQFLVLAFIVSRLNFDLEIERARRLTSAKVDF